MICNIYPKLRDVSLETRSNIEGPGCLGKAVDDGTKYDLKIQVSGPSTAVSDFDFHCFVITWLHLCL